MSCCGGSCEAACAPVAKIAALRPVWEELTVGETYYYCTCGLSKKQPFCDGAHKGTGFKPQAFVAEAEKEGDKTVRKCLCQCKQTANAPFCDGKHKPLRDAAERKRRNTVFAVVGAAVALAVGVNYLQNKK
eukprot:TRINITY_DN272_c0_g1_i1.p1 TRINITY_DN272_c0_g1~~TRINITY_DN272_c0_g1_i1.p1  ORF type:complete len:131 (+),score=39.91 TRINITY_DN272_c0_g1_i1:56-448(+)